MNSFDSVLYSSPLPSESPALERPLKMLTDREHFLEESKLAAKEKKTRDKIRAVTFSVRLSGEDLGRMDEPNRSYDLNIGIEKGKLGYAFTGEDLRSTPASALTRTILGITLLVATFATFYFSQQSQGIIMRALAVSTCCFGLTLIAQIPPIPTGIIHSSLPNTIPVITPTIPTLSTLGSLGLQVLVGENVITNFLLIMSLALIALQFKKIGKSSASGGIASAKAQLIPQVVDPDQSIIAKKVIEPLESSSTPLSDRDITLVVTRVRNDAYMSVEIVDKETSLIKKMTPLMKLATKGDDDEDEDDAAPSVKKEKKPAKFSIMNYVPMSVKQGAGMAIPLAAAAGFSWFSQDPQGFVAQGMIAIASAGLKVNLRNLPLINATALIALGVVVSRLIRVLASHIPHMQIPLNIIAEVAFTFFALTAISAANKIIKDVITGKPAKNSDLVSFDIVKDYFNIPPSRPHQTTSPFNSLLLMKKKERTTTIPMSGNDHLIQLEVAEGKPVVRYVKLVEGEEGKVKSLSKKEILDLRLARVKVQKPHPAWLGGFNAMSVVMTLASSWLLGEGVVTGVFNSVGTTVAKQQVSGTLKNKVLRHGVLLPISVGAVVSEWFLRYKGLQPFAYAFVPTTLWIAGTQKTFKQFSKVKKGSVKPISELPREITDKVKQFFCTKTETTSAIPLFDETALLLDVESGTV